MTDDETSDRAHVERMKATQAEVRSRVKKAVVRRGIVVVNTGDGKGKSTAAFGMVLRAVGHGQRVGIVQFIKGTWRTGEQAVLGTLPGVEHFVSGKGFTWNTQDRDKDIASVENGWEIAERLLSADDTGPHLVVLDELNIALSHGYLAVDRVIAALQARPLHRNVVITGRRAPQELIDAADTVTEMTVVKHAFEAGVRAQRGVEF